jgi:hypothetical protein
MDLNAYNLVQKKWLTLAKFSWGRKIFELVIHEPLGSDEQELQ